MMDGMMAEKTCLVQTLVMREGWCVPRMKCSITMQKSTHLQRFWHSLHQSVAPLRQHHARVILAQVATFQYGNPTDASILLQIAHCQRSTVVEHQIRQDSISTAYAIAIKVRWRHDFIHDNQCLFIFVTICILFKFFTFFTFSKFFIEILFSHHVFSVFQLRI